MGKVTLAATMVRSALASLLAAVSFGAVAGPVVTQWSFAVDSGFTAFTPGSVIGSNTNPVLNAPSKLTWGTDVGNGLSSLSVSAATNGQFAGMGAHLHFEVRKRAFPGNYNRDTVDPNVLWYSLGFGNPGARIEVQRTVGGSILARAGGASDCAPGQSTELAGLLASFGDVPAGFVDLKDRYPAAITTAPAPIVEPPDYAPVPEAGVALPRPQNCPGGWQVLLPGAPCVSTGQAAGAGLAAVLLLGLGAAWAMRTK